MPPAWADDRGRRAFLVAGEGTQLYELAVQLEVRADDAVTAQTHVLAEVCGGPTASRGRLGRQEEGAELFERGRLAVEPLDCVEQVAVQQLRIETSERIRPR